MTQLGAIPASDQIITGYVEANGTINSGTGFSITKLGTGSYRVSFTASFSGIPCAVCTPANNNGAFATISGITASNVDYVIRSDNGSAIDSAFGFIAMQMR